MAPNNLNVDVANFRVDGGDSMTSLDELFACDFPAHPCRHDVIDSEGKVTLRHSGRLHHIGVGRTHARTPVIMLVQDLDIRVVHAATGELLRALTLDPSRSYQPTGRQPGSPPRNPA